MGSFFQVNRKQTERAKDLNLTKSNQIYQIKRVTTARIQKILFCVLHD